MKRLTTEEFIKRAKEVHGDKYDYSKIEYKNSKARIEVICPIHGSFWQIPNGHLSGNGCPKCNGGVQLFTETFIQKEKEIHGNKYDYSKVKYKNSKEKVCIICPKHGKFWQVARNHLHGAGCSKCNGGVQLATQDFIQKAKEIHGNKYDYSKAKYKKATEKVEIVCPEHGSFWQTPANHLQGQGCPVCNKKNKLTTEEFIKRAQKVHENKYNYSKTGRYY